MIETPQRNDEPRSADEQWVPAGTWVMAAFSLALFGLAVAAALEIASF